MASRQKYSVDLEIGLKKSGELSILRMYPMKQVCLDEPGTSALI